MRPRLEVEVRPPSESAPVREVLMTQDQLPFATGGNFGAGLNGETAKREGMATAELHSSPEWNDRIDMAIWLKAATGDRFTSEDIRELVGDPPSPGTMGARISAAAGQGIIKHVDWAVPRRRELHGHWIRVWQGIPEVERGPG